MARQNPLSEIDRQIGQRLRQFRIEKMGLTAAEFARRLGIDSNRLATYEHGRVPLRFEFAHAACREFNISQRWLAKGLEPARHNIRIPRELRESIPNRSLFSDAYEQFLKQFIERYFANLAHLWGGKLDKEGLKVIEELRQNSLGFVSGLDVVHFLFKDSVQIIDDIPPDLFQDFYSEIIQVSRKFKKCHAERIKEWQSTPKSKPTPEWVLGTEKSSFTNVPLIGNNLDVKAKLPSLLKRLNEAARERGVKTALAKFMGVPLSKISQWLSGTHEPGGETTLRLLHWVEQQERQK